MASITQKLPADADVVFLGTEDTREQPWKKYIAAEKAAENMDSPRGRRPWVNWAPKEEAPWAKPWVEWHHELGRSLSPSQGS